MTINRKLLVRKIDLKVLLLSAICVCCLSPAVQRTVGTVSILTLIGLYLISERNNLIRINLFERNTAIFVCLYLLMLLSYSLVGISDKGAGQTGSVFFFMSYFLIIPIYKSLERKHCIYLMAVCIATIFITIGQNYALWVQRGFTFTQQWYRRGFKQVINTQYVNAIMLFSGVLLCIFLYKKGTRTRYLFLALAIMCFVFNVMVPQRTITTLLSIVMFLLLQLVNVDGNVTRRSIIRFALLIILLIVFALQYRVLLTGLANIIKSERIRVRINSIISFLSTKSIEEVEEGSLTGRIRLIGVSIHTFFATPLNFLFGVGDKADNLLVGNHSYFFDELAKFGILGGLLSFVTVYRMGETAKRISCAAKPEALYKLVNMLFQIVIIRSFIGGILAPATGIVLYVFAPITFRLLKFDKERTWETYNR